MQIRLETSLPFVALTLTYRSQSLDLKNVLVDTGSAGSIFSADRVADIGLFLEPQDPIFRIRGVGGSEFVFAKTVDRISVGELQREAFQIEVGAMDYGFDIDGILGMEFLLQVGAVLDLGSLELRSS